jgi:hypothetical protein
MPSQKAVVFHLGQNLSSFGNKTAVKENPFVISQLTLCCILHTLADYFLSNVRSKLKTFQKTISNTLLLGFLRHLFVA